MVLILSLLLYLGVIPFVMVHSDVTENVFAAIFFGLAALACGYRLYKRRGHAPVEP
jgi:hypothetical protein